MMRHYSPIWPEVVLYILGMFLIALGLSSSLVSIDPHPFPSDSWWQFLVTGILLIAVGSCLLTTIRILPTKGGGMGADETTCSAADLLEHSTAISVSEVASISRDLQEGVHMVKSCMMTQSPTANTSVLFYRETFV